MSASAQPPDEQEIELAEAPILTATVGAVPVNGESIGTLDDIGLPDADAPMEGRRARLTRIGKPIAGFFGVQVIVQILTMLSGLLLVHNLSKTEYAYFTIANAMQGTIAVLGDSGITSALSAVGGVVWQDRRRFGELIQTALEFRRKFAFAIFLITGPLLWWLLHSNGGGTAYSLLLCVIVLGGASLSLVHGVLIVVPRLHSRVAQLQKAEFVLAFLRLILVGAACLFFVNAAVAAAIFLVTLGIQNVLYRRWASVDADLSAPTNSDDRKKIWQSVRHQVPGSLFACFQGQLLVFVIGFFGSTSSVAEVGALGRLTVVLTIVSSLMSNLIFPRFARCQEKRKLQLMYGQVLGFYAGFSILVLSLVVLFPGPILWLLGAKYAGLGRELVYLTGSSMVAACVGALYGLNYAKGWIEWSWTTIPLTIAAQVAMLPFINLSSISDIALLGGVAALVGAIPFVIRAFVALRDFGNDKFYNDKQVDNLL